MSEVLYAFAVLHPDMQEAEIETFEVSAYSLFRVVKLNGSSSASDTYGNSCLACSEDFEVKEIELWGFVYASKYEEMVSLLRTETPGIARW
ncbi:hypothetical protein C3L33_18110, partial [Rhododendron williamsianum]